MGIFDSLATLGKRVLDDPSYFSHYLSEYVDLPPDSPVKRNPACERDQFIHKKLFPWETYDRSACDEEISESNPETENEKSSAREVLGKVAAMMLFPGHQLLGYEPENPLGKIDGFLESSGVYRGLRFLHDGMKKSAEARRERLKNMEENGIEISAGEVAEKIAEHVKGQLNNVRVNLKDGRIEIKADVPTDYLVTVEFSMVMDVSIRDGKVDGEVKKATGAGMNKMDMVKDKLFNALRAQGQSVPDDAGLKDLSWMENQGIKNLVVQDGRILVEFYPPSTGPS